MFARHTHGTMCMLFFVVVGVASAAQISEYSRDINLRGYVTRITDTVTFKSPVSTADFCYPSGHWQHAASLHCALGDDTKLRHKLPYKQTSVSGQPKDVSCVTVTLPDPTNTIICKLSTGHQLRPNPSRIAQYENQLVEYTGTVQALSPYTVSSQTVSLKLASEKIESYSQPKGIAVTKKGSIVTYENIKGTKPFQVDDLKVHFGSNKPFLHILDLQREITVSHWGRVYVTERYHVKHGGADVKGEFSRWNVTEAELQPKKSFLTPHIYTLTTYLHSLAQQVTLKDDLGNIMTSSELPSAGMLRVGFSPRYPLLGGWQTRFVLGYVLPLQACVSSNARGQKEVVFGQSPVFEEDFYAESVQTTVILPEGSTDVKVALGRLKADVTEDRTFTYLDTMIGRPTKVIQGGPMTADDADAMVRVTYTFSPLFAALEPALLVGAFTALFLMWLAASHMDFTIVKGREWHAKQAQAKAQDVLRKASAAVSTLERRAADVAGSADCTSATVASLKTQVSSIENCLEELKQLGSTKAADLATLLENCTKLVTDVQKVQSSKAKDKRALCSDISATLAQTQIVKASALAGV